MKKELIIKGQVHNLEFNEVIERFKPLCIKFSNKMFIDGYDKDDLLQTCYISIHRAYNAYDISKQNDFLTLCYECINNEFKRLIRDSNNKKRNTSSFTFIDINQKTGFSSQSLTYAETIPDSVNVEDEVVKSSLIKTVNECLTDDEKLMLPILMGLKTQKQYSVEVGISNEGARRRVDKLKLKLRQKLAR